MRDPAEVVERISAIVRDSARLRFPRADNALRIAGLMYALVEEILEGSADEARARKRLGHVLDGLWGLFELERRACAGDGPAALSASAGRVGGSGR